MTQFESSSITPIRVMLVDGQPIVLLGLETLIDGERPTMEVVGKTVNSDEARRMARELQPDIILLGLRLDGGDGTQLIRDFVKHVHARVLIFTGIRDHAKEDRAVINGAHGLVRKEESNQTLLTAIQKVHAGELWLDRGTTSRIFSEFVNGAGSTPVDSAQTIIESLTRKERKIIAAFASMPGAKNKKVAETLFISDHTLRNNLTAIFAKLKISSRCGLCEFAKLYGSQLESDATGSASIAPEFLTQE